MQKTIIIILLGLAAAVTGCAHKIDIQQGNVITKEKLAKIAPGMSRRQVQFALGTPLLTDPFHADRWDYYYSYQPSEGDITRYRATIFFENDRVARITTGGDIPETYQPPPSYLREQE